MKWDWRKFYDQAYDWVLYYAPKTLAAIIVLIVGLWLIRVLNKWVKRGLSHRRINASVRYFLQNLVAITLMEKLVTDLKKAGIKFPGM
jgi:small conductance mechanosensitive channel